MTNNDLVADVIQTTFSSRAYAAKAVDGVSFHTVRLFIDLQRPCQRRRKTLKSALSGLSLAIVALAILPIAASAADLTVAFADPSWAGDKIPKGQHCKKFGGKGATPPLVVSGIPAGANAIVVEFNDGSYFELSDDGGHGKVGFLIPDGATEATLIAVPGGTNALPEGTWLVKKNRARGAWRSEGYLPPCSGGKRHTYSADVIAVAIDPANKKVQEELAETTIRLGKY